MLQLRREQGREGRRRKKWEGRGGETGRGEEEPGKGRKNRRGGESRERGGKERLMKPHKGLILYM